MPVPEIVAILQTITPILMAEGSLAECSAPCKVVGDLHGQFQHMQQLFDVIGRVPQQRLLFLGDYVDRGPFSIEFWAGTHLVGLWWDFQGVFNRLPLAGLISGKILCMHGGLSPELKSLETIRGIIRPCEPLEQGLLTDLLWADPTNKGDGWFHSIRGISYMFGKGVVQHFCDSLGVDLIIRAHQVVQDGYEFMIGRKLITVFSAPNYCNQFSNAAAVVVVDQDLKISFQQMRVSLPEGSAAKPAPVIAAEEVKIDSNPKQDVKSERAKL